MKARNEKVNRLKEVIEAKDATIKNLEAKVKHQKYPIVEKNKMIDYQSKTILKQSKDLISYEGIIKEQGIELKNKDRLINQLRKEKEDNHDIQLTEVIREKEFIEVHTVGDNDDCKGETSQSRHCEGCQCFVIPDGIFESDLAKKMKTEHVNSEIKSEKF